MSALYQKEPGTMSSAYHTFTGPVSRLVNDDPGAPSNRDAQRQWLIEHPTHVARIQMITDPTYPRHFLKKNTARAGRRVDAESVFAFTLRVIDPREAIGWRAATIILPGTSWFDHDEGIAIMARWRVTEVDVHRENEFVLRVLNEASYLGDTAMEAVPVVGGNALVATIVSV